MKDYIFTYDALKKIKDAGGVLNWEEISEQQLKYLYLDEDILSSTIADLYNVTNSKVAYKRQKFKIKKMITQVRHKLLSDQKENLKKFFLSFESYSLILKDIRSCPLPELLR